MKAIATDIEEFLSDEEIQLIRKESRWAEEHGCLKEPILQLIYEKKWLKVMEPASCGGLEWGLPKVVRLFEALAYADGNVGWCVNLGAGANLFSGYFKEENAKEIFSNLHTWCAGSGAITGNAYKRNDGYIVSGKWKYASGSLHATHFTANAYLFDEDSQQIVDNGNPVFRSFIFPAGKVKILDTWKVSGLKATSSNDFEVHELFVPEADSFSLLQPSPFVDAPVFHFPFETLAIINMTSMATGMAIHFLELFQDLMQHKRPMHSGTLLGEQQFVQKIFLDCSEKLLKTRTEMYVALEDVWQLFLSEKGAEKEPLERLSAYARTAASSARDVLYRLFPYCGMNIIYADSALNKVWRDLSVAGQHYLLSPSNNRVSA